MWISKPVGSLTDGEKSLWRFAHRAVRGPLSQGLPWAAASELGTDGSFLVFQPTEGVGGVVFRWKKDDGSYQYECVNGPLLDWDDAEKAPRQFATFVQAVTQLGNFGSLILRPRWDALGADARIEHLPVEPFSIDAAATIHVALQTARPEERLVRSARRAEDAGAVLERRPLMAGPELRSFADRLQKFARMTGFMTPPAEWFEKLVGTIVPEDQLRFERVRVAVPGGRTSEIVLAVEPESAFFLFGQEDGEGLSASPFLHMRLMGELALEGIQTYDLGGYVESVPSDHPYVGVNSFKEQFAGNVVRYVIPEFRIEP